MASVPRLPGRRSARRRDGVAASDTAEPDAAGADAAGPGIAGPDAAGPDAAGPDAAGPGIAGPDADEASGRATLGELVARAADDSGDRRGQLLGLTRAVGTAARDAGSGARGVGQLLADALSDAAPRIKVRDADTLRSHHPGRSDDQIADVLVRNAGRTTGTFGAVVGALAAVEFAAPPTYLVAPVQLAAETLAVAAVEIKLVAELHELYGEAAVGTGAQRGSAYLMSWVHQRALDPQAGAAGLSAVLGYAAKRELRSLLMRRMSRSVSKLAPFLAGAVAGAAVNRRATRNLGDKLTAELRGRHSTVLPG